MTGGRADGGEEGSGRAEGGGGRGRITGGRSILFYFIYRLRAGGGEGAGRGERQKPKAVGGMGREMVGGVRGEGGGRYGGA